jgi:ribonuclease J
MGVARDLGYLTVPDDLIVDMKAVEQLPPEKVVLVSTGSQGEPMAALSRMANRSHHQIDRPERHRDPGELAHPGQRDRDLPRHQRLPLGRAGGAQGVPRGHVVRARSAGELLYLLNATRPSNVMPVHGEWRHLRAHAELARHRRPGRPHRAGRGRRRRRPRRRQGRDRRRGRVRLRLRRRHEVGDVTETTLKDRRILGDEGFISITVAVDSVTGKIAAGPEIAARGFSDDRSAFEPVQGLIEAELARQAAEGVVDAHQLAQAVRRVAGRWVSDTYRRRPMIIPVVVEV